MNQSLKISRTTRLLAVLIPLTLSVSTVNAGGDPSASKFKERVAFLIGHFNSEELREYQKLKREHDKCMRGVRVWVSHRKCIDRANKNLRALYDRVEVRISRGSASLAPAPSSGPARAFDFTKCREETENLLKLKNETLEQIKSNPAMCDKPPQVMQGTNCENPENFHSQQNHPEMKAYKAALKLIDPHETAFGYPKASFSQASKLATAAVTKAIKDQCSSARSSGGSATSGDGN